MDSFKTLNFDESDVFLPTNIEAIDSILGKLDLFPQIVRKTTIRGDRG